MQAPQQPHRPGPLHQTNKAHKGSRHDRKSSAHHAVKSKSYVRPLIETKRKDRLNRAIQNRKLKREKANDEKRKLGAEHQPPLMIGVLDIHLNSCSSFFDGFLNYDEESNIRIKAIDSRNLYVVSTKSKMRFRLVALDSSKFNETLDMVKNLDLLMLLHKPNLVEHGDDSYDGSKLLRAIRIHCLPTIIHVLDGTGQANVPAGAKEVANSKKILRSRLEKEDRFHSVEKPQDYLQLLHIVGTCKRQKSQFKDNRPTLVTDKVEVVGNALTFIGFVRKQVLNPNSLVHVVGYGDYQIKQIDILPDVIPLRPGSLEGSQVVQALKPDPMKQETLEEINDIDPMEGEQTWPTADELASEAERKNTRRIIKKLPRGTSAYQGAWIPEDSDEEYDSSNSNDGDGDAQMADEHGEDEEAREDIEGSDSELNDQQENEEDTMEVDDYDNRHCNEKELKILEKLKEARFDEMFPDEIDTPSDIPARVRFAKYRGLKSFRTSHWDPQENLPPDYSKIFQFQNFHQTKRRVLSERDEEGANPGQYVRLHLANISSQIITRILNQTLPPNIVGLLKYERKMTVMNLLIKRVQDSNQANPIKSKDELIFYVGFRKFKARPLFTTHSISSKFKYEKFLRDDVAMVATIYAPITFPPAPVLVFRTNYKNENELVASGSVLDSNPNRLIIKRIRLSGHPFKIHSKSAVIRFMFFNSEDVLYFKPVELISKYNRRGHITEPLGTHGHMKCTFDKKIRSDDCVFMNLYKRVFPKWTYSPIQETTTSKFR